MVARPHTSEHVKIDMWYCDLDETLCYYTGTMLRENKVLTSLQLRDFGLDQKGLCEVSSALVMSTTLIYLGLSGNMFNNQSIACLGRLVICSTSICSHGAW